MKAGPNAPPSGALKMASLTGTISLAMKIEGVSDAPLVPFLVSAGHAGPRPGKGLGGSRGRKGSKVPTGYIRIQRIAKEILRATSADDLMKSIRSLAPEYLIAKIAFVQEMMKDRFTLGNFAAFSRLSLSEGAGLLEKDGCKRLSKEAHLALKLAFDAFARCNARFLDAVKTKTLPQEIGLDLRSYVECVIAFELATNALALYVAGKARARHRELPNVLAGLCQAWGDEMTVYATRLGLFNLPETIQPLNQPRPRDEGVDAMAEAAWAQACRELAQGEK